MAFKNALFILSLLVMVVLIPSKVATRGFPKISSSPKTIEDAKKTNDQSEIGDGMLGVGNGLDLPGGAITAEESKINPESDGVGGVGHGIQCRRLCCGTLWGCVCC